MTMILQDTLLAERECPGYPGMTCELHVEDAGNFRVLVRTPVRSYEWNTRSRMIAKDWYFHPFTFGVEYKTPDWWRHDDDEDDGA